nr:MAG TPA: hypothetical protein [Caudoviricetes sp.]
MTVLCRKAGRSIDLGYFGFKRLRDTFLIEALNIDKSFLTYLNQLYFDFVDCGRQSVDEFQE